MVKIADLRYRLAKSAVALLLAFSAGFVDIVGYLALYQLFTAHMTGTTVQLAHWGATHDWRAAAIAAGILAAFVLGSVAGRIVIEMGSRVHVRSIASATLFLELLLLAGVIQIGQARNADGQSAHFVGVLLFMLACAMGLQTATLTRIGPLTIHTTFVTGMLNKLAQLVAHGIYRGYDFLRSRSDQEKLIHRNRGLQEVHNALFIFAIWLLYLTGAISGTLLELRWKLLALYVPVSALLITIAIDQVRPLSVEEERDQSER